MYRLTLLLVVLYISDWTLADAPSYTWNCSNNKCERTISSNGLYKSVEVCRLVCGQTRSLWPKPSKMSNLSTTLVKVHPNYMYFGISEDPDGFFGANLNILRENLLDECGVNCSEEDAVYVTIKIEVSSSNTSLFWDTDESYELSINIPDITIKAETIYGARHALETFKQLCAAYTSSEESIDPILVTITTADITDKPKYTHRGVMLDTARNFLSFDAIRRQIDAMSASKMNVFHWHITDSQSFPFESSAVPQLSKYGAYSKDKIYKIDETSALVKYARLRGVRVIFEFDAPAHAGNGWQFGEMEGLGKLSLCVNQRPYNKYCIQPPCGQLNPINDNLYPILGQLYEDFIRLVPSGEVFHMGGDEVFINCWNSSSEITDYLQRRNITPDETAFLDLWGDFQKKALEQYDEKSGNTVPIMLWTSHLTQPAVIEKYLDKDRYVIHSWVPSNDNLPETLTKLGYKMVITTKDKWYLDHGYWGSTQFHKWQDEYSNTILDHPNILGGEACSWGEYIDDNGIDSRVWPRAAAVAERLWSNPKTNLPDAQIRIANHRARLVRRGIQAQAVIPEWCYQTEGECV